ncbi:tail fiber assembly protein [Vagococcus sp. WN89Y]|uniref:tail fiber assembly protein n=1 Tax=Vagococcus sp. WN89Y TaxID=3457258 RepID=UPI003FCC4264
MINAKLNNEYIATEAGDITVYNFDGKTREYLSSAVEFLAVGVGIPANSCIDKPGKDKEGFAICRREDLTTWEYVADRRGETVYSTDTGEKIVVSLPGSYPKNTTTQMPATPYDKWNGSEWVTDSDAQQAAQKHAAAQQKSALLAEAQSTINIWQTELQLGIITDKDKASLIAWLAYIKDLQKVNPDAAPEITWPDRPVV